MDGALKSVVEAHISREERAFIALISKRGIVVDIKQPRLLNADGSQHDKTYDDFEINVKRVSARGLPASNIDFSPISDDFLPVDGTARLIFDNDGFGEFRPISHGQIVSALQGSDSATDAKNNFNDLYAYIYVRHVLPLGSIVVFRDFSGMSFKVVDATKKRQMTQIFRYKLSRT